MHGVTSFHSSRLSPAQAGRLIAEYLAFEQARARRRLCQTPFLILAATSGAIGFGLHWLSPLASWASVALCLSVPALAWAQEVRHDIKLTRKLSELPPGAAQVTLCGIARKS